MNIPDPIVYTGVASLIGLQAWIVRELFALKQAIAELRGQKHRTSRAVASDAPPAYERPVAWVPSAVGLRLSTPLMWCLRNSRA